MVYRSLEPLFRLIHNGAFDMAEKIRECKTEYMELQ
jgi:hypothetical protein